jgi:hypothetical protein
VVFTFVTNVLAAGFQEGPPLDPRFSFMVVELWNISHNNYSSVVLLEDMEGVNVMRTQTQERTNFKQVQVMKEISRMEERIRQTQSPPEVLQRMTDQLDELKKKLLELQKNQQRQRKHRAKRMQLQKSDGFLEDIDGPIVSPKFSPFYPIPIPMVLGTGGALHPTDRRLSSSCSSVVSTTKFSLSSDYMSINFRGPEPQRSALPIVDNQLLSLTCGRVVDIISGLPHEFNVFIYLSSPILLTQDPRLAIRLFQLRGCYLMDVRCFGRNIARHRLAQLFKSSL